MVAGVAAGLRLAGTACLFASFLSIAAAQAVAPPEFEPVECDSPVALDVAVSHPDSGAEIRYTLNGEDPVLSDPAVAPGGVVHIARTTVLKARAWVGGTGSAVASCEYRITGAIAYGDKHGLALSVSGKAWAWGLQDDGRLGNGLTASGKVLVPDEVLDEAGAGQFANARDLAGGQEHSLLVSGTGAVYAFGRNSKGELGDNSATDSVTPPSIRPTS